MPETLVVVLAAGASRRLGEPKALARLSEVAGDTALARLLRAAAHVATDLVVVTGCHHVEIERYHAELELPGHVLHNPAWEHGRTGGLALAAAARPGADLCVAPVDVPLVPGAVFEALAAAWAARGAPASGWLAPRHSGAYGHPVWIGRALANRLGELEPGADLRRLRAWAEPRFGVTVDSPRVLDDLDTPLDLARLRELVRG